MGLYTKGSRIGWLRDEIKSGYTFTFGKEAILEVTFKQKSEKIK